MTKYNLTGQTLTIVDNMNLYDFEDFKNFYNKHRKEIQNVIVQAEIDINIAYLLIQLQKEGKDISGIDLGSNKYAKIRDVNYLPEPDYQPKTYTVLDHLDILIPSFQMTKLQLKFWISTFVNFLYIFIIENSLIVFVLFSLFGLGLTYFMFIKLTVYSAQYDSPKIIYLGVFKLIGPFAMSLFLIAKTATSACSLIKLKNINHEFRVMGMFNLPHKLVYLQPIVIASCIAGGVLNLLSVLSLFLGSSVAWGITSYRKPETFFRDIGIIFQISDLIASVVISMISGLCSGFIACATGLDKGKSVESVVISVNDCVFLSMVAISIIHSSIPIILGASFVK